MSGIASIGLDIGASLTKACFRVQDVGNTAQDSQRVISIAHGAQAANGQYRAERETAVWVHGSNISLEPRAGWTQIANLKERMLRQWDTGVEEVLDGELSELPVQALLMFHVMETLRCARRAINGYVVSRRLNRPQATFVNCAVPSKGVLETVEQTAIEVSSCPRRRGLAQLVERARVAVYERDRELPSVMTIGKAIAEWTRLECVEVDADPVNWRTRCVPEAVAAILGTIDHPSFASRNEPVNPDLARYLPTVLVIDCGSLTTEFALFHYDNRYSKRAGFFALGSCPAGVGLLLPGSQGDERYKDLTCSFYKEFWNDIFGRAPGGAMPVVIQAGHNVPQWRYTLLGGGSRNPFVKAALMELSLRSKAANMYRVAPMPPRQHLRLPDQALDYAVLPRRNSEHMEVVALARGQQVNLEQQQVREHLGSREYLHQLAVGLSQPTISMPTWVGIELEAHVPPREVQVHHADNPHFHA